MTSPQLAARLAKVDLDHSIKIAAAVTAKKFGRYVSFDDISQELWLYALGDGKKFVDKQLKATGDYWLKRALFGVARAYAEREKAVKSGYDPDDVAWYEPAQIANLIDMALDFEYDGINGESGDRGMPKRKSDGRGSQSLMDMIIDIRRAIWAMGMSNDPADYEMDDPAGLVRLEAIATWLGGEFPTAPGYRGRRAMSNATAAVVLQDAA